MSGGAAAPVHRCAFPTGPDEAADLAAQVCRSALAAGSPVVAYLDPDVHDRVASRVPRAATAVFLPQQDLVRATTVAAGGAVGCDLLTRSPTSRSNRTGGRPTGTWSCSGWPRRCPPR